MAAGMLNPLLPRQDGRLEWGNGVVSMLFDIAGDSPVRLCNVVGRGMIPIDGRLSDDGTPVVEKDPRPIVEVLAANTGSQDNRLALIATVAGSKLRFVSALASEPGQSSADPFRLEITQFASYADLEPKGREFESTASERDAAASAANPAPVTVCADPHEGLVVTSVFEAFPNLSAVRTHTRLQSAKQLPIEAVSSLNLTVPMRVNCGKVHRSNIFWGDAAWAVENDWRVRPLRDTQVRNRNQKINPGQSSSRFAMSSTSTWSTGVHEPAGIVQVEGSMRRARDFSVMWQIEHNGPWEWEVGEDDPGLHISAFGPEYQNHGWFTNLGEGNDFESVPVSFAIAAGGWWDMVGEWQASTNRFGDAGLRGLAENIRAHGMGLGLWLEPEVIGAKSPLASTLPDSAFFQRHGVRVCDSGRYLLDFRSPEAREHVTRTVDRLIDDFGAVFFKFDYNTIPGVGTDLNTESVGDGLLEHCRAYLDWLDDLRRRHPDVMIENCGSGAMRADYAQLSRLDLQSTSDQCDPLIYAAIAAGAGMTILPEQQGNWGYAQQEMDDETAVFTLATGVLGRLYLSGFIDRMTEPRLSLVRDAIALHRCVLADQQHMVPFWPSGLPDFDGDWLTVGLRHVETDMCDEHVLGCDASNGQNADPSNRQNDQQIQQEDKPDYIIVWRRGGTPSVNIPLEAGRTIEQVFPNPDEPDHAPDAEPWTIERMDPETVRLNATTSKRPSARIFAIRRRG